MPGTDVEKDDLTDWSEAQEIELNQLADHLIALPSGASEAW